MEAIVQVHRDCGRESVGKLRGSEVLRGGLRILSHAIEDARYGYHGYYLLSGSEILLIP